MILNFQKNKSFNELENILNLHYLFVIYQGDNLLCQHQTSFLTY